jgi:rSAM/selenodomain-associated transferase 2
VLHRFSAELRNRYQFFFINPNKSWLAGTTIAAASTLEPQTILIPWIRHTLPRPFGDLPAVSVSVIIPTLNEEGCLAETLSLLRRHQAYEIIVVDGGSTDSTCRIATAADLLLHGPRGRAAQMNLGAGRASGDIVLFLHADCSLEEGALPDAERLLSNRKIVAGCFTMVVRDHGVLYRLIDLCATARTRLTGLVYGDQGLFIRRDEFHKRGGFPSLALMEDLFFSRDLRKVGSIAISECRIFVSPRRWERVGLVRQTLRNWTLTALVAAGARPNCLAKYYPVVR